jgi:hypothetical protein
MARVQPVRPLWLALFGLAAATSGCATTRLWTNAQSALPGTVFARNLENAAVTPDRILHLSVRYEDGALCHLTTDVLQRDAPVRGQAAFAAAPRARGARGGVAALPRTVRDVTVLPAESGSAGQLARYAAAFQTAQQASGFVLWLEEDSSGSASEITVVDAAAGGPRRFNQLGAGVSPDYTIALPERSSPGDPNRITWTALATPFTLAFDAATAPFQAIGYALVYGVFAASEPSC